MLCQSILGVSDDTIISDYHMSERLLNPHDNEGSAAASAAIRGEVEATSRKGKLSREIFSGSPAKVMASTLDFIRDKYGAVNNYLDTIGFDSVWRERLITATANDNGNQSTSSILLNSKL